MHLFDTNLLNKTNLNMYSIKLIGATASHGVSNASTRTHSQGAELAVLLAAASLGSLCAACPFAWQSGAQKGEASNGKLLCRDVLI